MSRSYKLIWGILFIAFCSKDEVTQLIVKVVPEDGLKIDQLELYIADSQETLIYGKKVPEKDNSLVLPGTVSIWFDNSTDTEIRLVIYGYYRDELVGWGGLRTQIKPKETVNKELKLLTGEVVDKDGDKFPDSLDNCESIFNLDQKDTDSDGRGDACEEQHCIDNDRDGYGEGCDLGPDCDDSEFHCNVDCEKDIDGDRFRDCDDPCVDKDRDNYGVGPNCRGEDCDDNVASCNIDCEKDDNHNGHRDCDEDCIDNDRDGYGEGRDCLGRDCDDNIPECNLNCEDQDGDGVVDCNLCINEPIEVGHFKTTTQIVETIVSYPYLYITGPLYGLGILDVSDLNNIREVSKIGVERIGAVTDMISYQNYIIVVGMDLSIVNVTNKEAPNVDLTLSIRGLYLEMTLYNNYLFLVGGYSSDRGDLMIIDISQITSPQIVYEKHDYPSRLSSIRIQGRYLYVLDFSNGINIYDLSPEPTNPSLITTYPMGIPNGEYLRLEVKTSYLYVVERKSGVYVIDIANITHPQQIAHLSLPQEVLGITLYGNYAFIGNGANGVRIVDISEPRNPRILSSYDTQGDAVLISYHSGYLYVADLSNGVVILSLKCSDKRSNRSN